MSLCKWEEKAIFKGQTFFEKFRGYAKESNFDIVGTESENVGYIYQKKQAHMKVIRIEIIQKSSKKLLKN